MHHGLWHWKFQVNPLDQSLVQAVRSFRRFKQKQKPVISIEDVDGKGIVEIAASNKSAIDAALAKFRPLHSRQL